MNKKIAEARSSWRHRNVVLYQHQWELLGPLPECCSPVVPLPTELLFLCTVSHIRNKRWSVLDKHQCLTSWLLLLSADRLWTEPCSTSYGTHNKASGGFQKDVKRHERQANGQSIRKSLNFNASQHNYCNPSWAVWKLHRGDIEVHKGTCCFDWNTTCFLFCLSLLSIVSFRTPTPLTFNLHCHGYKRWDPKRITPWWNQITHTNAHKTTRENWSPQVSVGLLLPTRKTTTRWFFSFSYFPNIQKQFCVFSSWYVFVSVCRTVHHLQR